MYYDKLQIYHRVTLRLSLDIFNLGQKFKLQFK